MAVQHDVENEKMKYKTHQPVSLFHKIRNDESYREQVDVYIDKHSMADISHGVCPECLEKHSSDYAKKIQPYCVCSTDVRDLGNCSIFKLEL